MLTEKIFKNPPLGKGTESSSFMSNVDVAIEICMDILKINFWINLVIN